MHILFLTHYFWPEGNAPATRVYEMTRRWARAGHRVTVVTGVPNVPCGRVYQGYRNRLLQRESVEGVEVLRVWTYVAPNRGVVRRTANYLSFMVSGALAGRRVARPDVVVATSPQFFCGWAGVFAARFHRRPFVLEVRDLWPESIEAVGALRARPLLRTLARMERALYKAAARVVTVGPSYRDRLRGRGVPAEKLRVVPNGVDVSFWSAERDPALARRYDLEGHFVCATLGTIGMASGLDVVLRAARRLKDAGDDRFRFLLVGDGAVRESLQRQATREGLASVVFAGLQPHARMPSFMALADACLVHLRRRELFRTVWPSKMLEAMAAAKPIVLGVEGAAADLLREAGAGVCVPPEDDAALLDALNRLAADPAARGTIGQAGRRFVAARFDLNQLAETYCAVLEETARTGGP